MTNPTPQEQFAQAASSYFARDYENAYRMALQLAEKGLADAQYLLWNMYLKGHYVEQNREVGLEWLQRAADQGLPSAQAYLGGLLVGQLLIDGFDIPRDEERGARLMEAASNNEGAAGFHYNLAMLYVQGTGVVKDDRRAAELLKKAANLGHAGAQFELGRALYDGRGIEKDVGEAARYCWLAFEQDYEDATKWADSAAADWFRTAAEKGDAEAQFRLASLILKNNGPHGDNKQAIAFLTQSAEQGHHCAQMYLGVLYANGIGTTRNPMISEQWFSAAVS